MWEPRGRVRDLSRRGSGPTSASSSPRWTRPSPSAFSVATLGMQHPLGQRSDCRSSPLGSSRSPAGSRSNPQIGSTSSHAAQHRRQARRRVDASASDSSSSAAASSAPPRNPSEPAISGASSPARPGALGRRSHRAQHLYPLRGPLARSRARPSSRLHRQAVPLSRVAPAGLAADSGPPRLGSAAAEGRRLRPSRSIATAQSSPRSSASSRWAATVSAAAPSRSSMPGGGCVIGRTAWGLAISLEHRLPRPVDERRPPVGSPTAVVLGPAAERFSDGVSSRRPASSADEASLGFRLQHRDRPRDRDRVLAELAQAREDRPRDAAVRPLDQLPASTRRPSRAACRPTSGAARRARRDCPPWLRDRLRRAARWAEPPLRRRPSRAVARTESGAGSIDDAVADRAADRAALRARPARRFSP